MSSVLPNSSLASWLAERGASAAGERFLFPMLKYGPNNQFLCLMQCAKLAKDTHRTLVLPVLQAWQNDLETQQHVWPFEQVFDAGRLRGYVRVASLAEFIRRTGGALEVVLEPLLDYMKFDRARSREGLRANQLSATGALALDNEHMSGEQLKALLLSELKDVAAVALAPMPHVKSILYPRTVPQIKFEADYALLRAVRYAPFIVEMAVTAHRALAERLQPSGVRCASP